jgi:hypothetical protein
MNLAMKERLLSEIDRQGYPKLTFGSRWLVGLGVRGTYTFWLASILREAITHP